MAGRATRNGECTISGMASIMLDGAGSRANGSTPTSRPFSTSAVKAPQWASDGKRARVMGGPGRLLIWRGRMSLLRHGLNLVPRAPEGGGRPQSLAQAVAEPPQLHELSRLPGSRRHQAMVLSLSTTDRLL